MIAYENMTEHLKNYINHNLQGDDLFMQGVYGNLIHMELDNIAVNGALSACEEGGISLRRQAVDAIKQDVGITYLEKQVSGWLPCRARELWISICWRSRRKQRKSCGADRKKMGTLFEEEEQEDNAVTFYEAGILNLVADREELSAREITLSQYASHRVHFESGGLSVPESYADDFWDELFFTNILCPIPVTTERKIPGQHMKRISGWHMKRSIFLRERQRILITSKLLPVRYWQSGAAPI